MRPGTTALLDQADAATADAARLLALFGAIDGTPIRHTVPGPVFAAIHQSPAAAVPHRPGQPLPPPVLHSPEPAFWCAWVIRQEIDRKGRLVSVPKIICDRKTRDILGEDGLAEVRAQLYAVDCQTCGRPLGTGAPALVVNEADEWAMAELHHRGCRAAEWNDGTVIGGSAGATITWRAESALFPVPTASGERASCAALIVNPSLEVLWLYAGAAGWRPGYHAVFSAVGLAPSGPVLVLRDRIAPGVTARIGDAEIAAVLRQPAPQDEYLAAAAPQTVAAARAHGFLLVVTHALNPSDLASTGDRAGVLQVLDAIKHERAITGWAAPEGS